MSLQVKGKVQVKKIMNFNLFEDMPIWQKAMDLAVKIFNLTEDLPRKEDYGLTSQIRDSGLSVSGNLAFPSRDEESSDLWP